ncbi:Galactose mutarotase [Sphingomonas guangdongensis]|uniref:Galactose mutarotase n=1 Tax=Sphingomonas guangdongensis TaxID=1141890 RepID=A0A285QFU3_9SPHN|nr:aldose 1-epimerase family protein [Sphingomonas guangdongensis]SOB78942.1 Galactose mutarotase [Sphingomonas guangdongensis]
MADLVTIGSGALTAEINPHGAELTHLRDQQGRELMTNADPAFWTGRAPLLFPIVGALAQDRYRIDGAEYAMPKHGFARRSNFEVVESGDASARFRLVDSDATRADYPFAFALEQAFVVEDATLTMTATLTNPGDRDLPASFGYHPALAWPLPGAERAAATMVFDAEEGVVKVLDGAGLIAGERPTPLDGRTLDLRDELFADDALIWTAVVSRGLTYGQLRIEWDAPALGVWTKPGAAFVCVEPWWGYADPAGFTGEIWDKPGIMRLAPGEVRTFGMRVTLLR